MKAEELMIGDWVFCTYPSMKKPVRVEEIRTVGDNELKIIISDDDLRLVFAERYIEPISLTPEILEKNANGGWCNYQSEPKGRSIYHIGEVAVYVEWERIVPSPYIELHGLGDTFFKGYVDSVHQLQHALRLCGIEKEIVI